MANPAIANNVDIQDFLIYNFIDIYIKIDFPYILAMEMGVLGFWGDRKSVV